MDQDVPPQLLEYESCSANLPLGDVLLRRMIHRRRMTLCLECALFFGLAFWPPIGLIAALVLPIAAILTLVAMRRYASANLGRRYAVRHVLLAILLSPIFLLSMFLVSMLVEGDIERLHLESREGR